MNVIVTGGRNYTDAEAVGFALAPLNPSRVIHGGCTTGTKTSGSFCGADGLAHAWAIANDVTVDVYEVVRYLDGDWPGAGPCRNARMLRLSWPDLVLAFPGGRGTADCCRQAEALGFKVVRVA